MAATSTTVRDSAFQDAGQRSRMGADGNARRGIVFTRRSDASIEGIPRYLAAVALLVTFGSMLWMYFRRIGRNPAGFFCDEAEIGLRTWQLIHGTLPAPSLRFPVFYQHFDTIQTGALPLYTTAPFMMLFGPSDRTVRLASAFWSVVAIAALLLLVRTLGLRSGWVGVAAFAMTPVAIHIGRITFAHAGSFAAVSSGLLVYALARERMSLRLAIPAGALVGISVYGYGAWYFAAPLLLVSLALGELVVNGVRPRGWKRWKPFVWAALTSGVVWIPVAYRALTNPDFMNRLRTKEASAGVSGGWSVDRVEAMLRQYPKYFSLDYLFRLGENGPILRHTVVGAGLFQWTILPLVLIGIVAVLVHRRGTAKVIGIAALAVTAMIPFPDLPTTSAGMLPYTFSVYSMLIGIPILCAFAVHLIAGMIGGNRATSLRRAIVPVVMSGIVLAGAWSFYLGPYENYPMVSAGYWGWQFGPGPAIEGFIADNNQHDRYVLDGDFNAPDAFLDFYLVEHPDIRAKAYVARIGEIPIAQSTLYAVRAERWDLVIGPHDPIRRYAKVVDVIWYPDGTPAMYLISVSLQNTPAPIDNW